MASPGTQTVSIPVPADADDTDTPSSGGGGVEVFAWGENENFLRLQIDGFWVNYDRFWAKCWLILLGLRRTSTLAGTLAGTLDATLAPMGIAAYFGVVAPMPSRLQCSHPCNSRGLLCKDAHFPGGLRRLDPGGRPSRTQKFLFSQCSTVYPISDMQAPTYDPACGKIDDLVPTTFNVLL